MNNQNNKGRENNLNTLLNNKNNNENNNATKPKCNNNMNSPINNRQKIFANTLKDVLACQEATQVFMVLATHCHDVNLTIPAIHRAMEMNKACGLFKLYIINNSPNLLAAVALTELSLKVFQENLNKLESSQNASNCKKVIHKNIEVNKNLINSIKIMRHNLNK